MANGISRRDALKISGATVGSLALAWRGAIAAAPGAPGQNSWNGTGGWNRLDPPYPLTQHDRMFTSLRPFYPGEALGKHEMRISFMGTSVVERRSQVRSSVFVELGNGETFVFDAGSGVVTNYVAMGVPWSRMRKIFLTHLHGDHTSDLTHIYCFGPQGDGKSPLYLWGPSRSGIRNPDFGQPTQQYTNPEFFEDGTLDFVRHFREMNRWHTESQSFVGTRWRAGDGGPEAEGDGYDIYATELNWHDGSSAYWSTNTSLNPGNCWFASGNWVAYETPEARVSFFPAIHDRNGSVSYKLEWKTEGLSMIFTGDSKPSDLLIRNATDGSKSVDVIVSEIVVDPDIWVSRQTGLTDPTNEQFRAGMVNAEAVQENSHTPQKAFGYMMEQMRLAGRPPRLAVGTHFQSSDDTLLMAMDAIRSKYRGWVHIVTDLTVVNVTSNALEIRRALVSDYSWSAKWKDPRLVNGTFPPKYHDYSDCNPYRPMAPLAQFSPELLAHVIPGCIYDPQGWQCENAKSAAICEATPK